MFAPLQIGLSSSTGYITKTTYNTSILSMRPFDTWKGLYQDSLGSLPVTNYGQPVAIALDTQFNLQRGVQTVTNGDFSNGTNNWRSGRSGVLSMNGGRFRVTMSNFINAGGADQSLTLAPGSVYEISLDVSGFSSGIQGFFVRVGQRDLDAEDGSTLFISESLSTAQKVSMMFVPTTSLAYVFLQPFQPTVGNDEWIEFNSVSIRQIPGQHWIQPDVQKRPLTGFRSGRKVLSFDGVDDFLRPFTPLNSSGADYTFSTLVEDLSTIGQYQVPFGFLNSNYTEGFQIVNHNSDLRTYSESIYSGGAIQVNVPPLRNRGLVSMISAQAGRQAYFKIDHDRGDITTPADQHLILAQNSCINGRADLFDLPAPMNLGGFFLAQGTNAASTNQVAEYWARSRKVLSLDDQI